MKTVSTRSLRLAATACVAAVFLVGCGSAENTSTDAVAAVDEQVDLAESGSDEPPSANVGSEKGEVDPIDEESSSDSDEPEEQADVDRPGFPTSDTVVLNSGKVSAFDEVVGSENDQVLLWFYFPHWPTCRAEAPDVEQFASDNPDIKVVGVGTFDDRGLADEFFAETSPDSLELVWSESPELWRGYGVSAQHTTILLDSAGNEESRWPFFDGATVADSVR